MDIVDRLNMFLDSSGISSSKFADACGIHRPTLSQLRNGRNKKVSDEVIKKIHDAYPSLNVMWLMFGDGEMISGGGPNANSPKSLFDEDVMADGRMNLPADALGVNQPISFSGDFRPENNAPAAGQKRASTPSLQVRKIERIMIFYNDGSYETVVPK